MLRMFLIKLFPDKLYLKIKFYLKFGKRLKLNNPVTFNEKLQWLKINDRKDIYTKMVDKYAVKEYVSNIIGNEYVINTIGIYDKFEDIDFYNLPNKFVIKCTHDSGGIVIVKDKDSLDKEYARERINKFLKREYYYTCREWPYKNVKPRIIIDDFLESSSNDLEDYKFWCFNGEPKLCLVCTDRRSNLKETFFDMNWNLLDLKRPNHDIDKRVIKPINFELMKELSKKLSKDIPFVRVDFYEVNGKVYFGELTFSPAGGFVKFEPEEWDEKLGNWIDINNIEV